MPKANKPLLLSPMEDEMHIVQDSLIVKLMGHRGVVSTSNLGGGYRQDLAYIFNHSCAHHPSVIAKQETEVKEMNLDEYHENLARQLGLPTDTSTGMDTAARMDNMAVATREKHGVTVMTIATAGIDVNGGRAGDKATYNEFTHEGIPLSSGTINILIFVDANLSAGVLTRALMTATEAKSAALQELMANSLFSEGIATGSGTDSTIIVGNDDSDTTLYSSGKHVLLGEMIGESVKEAVTQALERQTGMSPKRQGSIEWQNKRYGITKENILRCHTDNFGVREDADGIRTIISEIDTDHYYVALTAAITHLCDQNRWGIISDDILISLSLNFMNQMLGTMANNEPNEHSTPKHISPGLPAYKEVLSTLLMTLATLVESKLSEREQLQ